jgi:DNA primase small subunit
MPHAEPLESVDPEVGEVKMEDDVPSSAPAAQQPAAEEDIDMADVAVFEEDQERKASEASRKEEKQEGKEDVKLEDLFADVDSDDEFPSSRPADGTLSSSSPGEMTPTSR